MAAPGRWSFTDTLKISEQQNKSTLVSMSNTSMQPLTLYPWVYVLRCAPRDGINYPTLYVGATLNAHQRITQHFTGTE